MCSAAFRFRVSFPRADSATMSSTRHDGVATPPLFLRLGVGRRAARESFLRAAGVTFARPFGAAFPAAFAMAFAAGAGAGAGAGEGLAFLRGGDAERPFLLACCPALGAALGLAAPPSFAACVDDVAAAEPPPSLRPRFVPRAALEPAPALRPAFATGLGRGRGLAPARGFGLLAPATPHASRSERDVWLTALSAAERPMTIV